MYYEINLVVFWMLNHFVDSITVFLQLQIHQSESNTLWFFERFIEWSGSWESFESIYTGCTVRFDSLKVTDSFVRESESDYISPDVFVCASLHADTRKLNRKTFSYQNIICSTQTASSAEWESMLQRRCRLKWSRTRVMNIEGCVQKIHK